MKAKLAKEVGAAFRDWGFFHCINHCIPKKLTDTVTENLKLFFHQPLEEKMKVQLDLTHPVSYNNNYFTSNVRDWVEIYDYILKDKIEVPVTHEQEDTMIMQLHNHRPAYPPGFQ
ncbi:1-aminocyclopropane-1-carboxylate oxidase-like [Amborella trichopoda]|nr:1-aminocyclopropane-1-carboxylate oxidase-like [Amborella trichopoda]|eukprot:XP_011624999.1 1-aminocyclopropane-1-carboxylate oxidase-like [Amborella trichopoda]